MPYTCVTSEMKQLSRRLRTGGERPFAIGMFTGPDHGAKRFRVLWSGVEDQSQIRIRDCQKVSSPLLGLKFPRLAASPCTHVHNTYVLKMAVHSILGANFCTTSIRGSPHRSLCCLDQNR
jgi:hypothetical protein